MATILAQRKKEIEDLRISNKLLILLENIFHVPWDKILAIQTFKETGKKLADLFTNDDLEATTNDVAMESNWKRNWIKPRYTH